MTTQETLLDISGKAEEIRQQTDVLLPHARDAALQIGQLSARLQLMIGTAIEALRQIKDADRAASADEMRLMANAALMAINE